MATITEQDSQQKLEKLLDFCQIVLKENEAMKDVLQGATLIVNVGDSQRELLLSTLSTRHQIPTLDLGLGNAVTYSETVPLSVSNHHGNERLKNNREENMEADIKSEERTTVNNRITSDEHKDKEDEVGQQRIEEKHKDGERTTGKDGCDRSNESVQGGDESGDAVLSQDDKPRFYKRDLLPILEERNHWKEQADSLRDEMEEWKRAAAEAQERVDHLESNIEDIQKRTGGFFYPNEIQAEALGILPRGLNFRPRPLEEASERYVTDVEVVGYAEKSNKFVFAIQLTWSDRRRFEIYRRYGEFFTFQNTLLLLFPTEAGKHKSSERIIPSLPTADNVLAILGATNSKSAVESRFQLVSDYCSKIILQLPSKISRSPVVYDFFRPRPEDMQLDSLERPRRHTMELSVYPLIPEGKPLGLYVAVADFEAPINNKSTNKISLKARESVRVVQQNDSGWWYVQKIDSGECGYVPESFIKKIGDPELLESPIDTSEILGFVTSVVFSPQDIDPSLKYIAIDDYDTKDERQLSFTEGAVLVIVERSEDGWWFATYNGKEGWVPSTYLESYSREHRPDKSDYDMTDEISDGQKYITTQNYTAKDEDEISLPSGVTVQVLEKSFSGWWKVKYKKNIGYAPATMLKQLDNLQPGEDVDTSPTHGLTHSVSGIKKPPPRRKFLLETIEKRRTQTFITPIDEKEEQLLTSTKITEEEVITSKKRHYSFKNWWNNFGKSTVGEGVTEQKRSSSLSWMKEEREKTMEVTDDNDTNALLKCHTVAGDILKLPRDYRPRSEHISANSSCSKSYHE